MAKKAKTGRIKKAYNKAAKHIPAVMDVGNKVWVLAVVFTLWGSAYVIFACSEAGVPVKLKEVLAGGLFTLGLMYLFANLRTADPDAVK